MLYTHVCASEHKYPARTGIPLLPSLSLNISLALFHSLYVCTSPFPSLSLRSALAATLMYARTVYAAMMYTWIHTRLVLKTLSVNQEEVS